MIDFQPGTFQAGTSQPGIFDKRFGEQVFLEYALARGMSDADVREALSAVLALGSDDVVITLAFGPQLWAMLDGRFDFPPFSLEGQVPATQGDLLVWIQTPDRSHGFDASLAVHRALGDRFSTQLEINGFVYHDMRDLTGFVDGIGNPQGDKAHQAALVGDGHPGAGGSFVLTQKWIHDLDAFEALSVPEQERVIGRTKADAVEFSDEDMPADAHVGRTDVARDGVPQKIWRRSVPYGNTTEHGSYFVAFSSELDRFDYLLRRMYGMIEDGVRDRLTTFSSPVMSSWWYAPTTTFLKTFSSPE